MTEYAKKTCHECGRRLPQPQMKKVTRSIEVGRSKRSLSGREVVGTLLGSEKSAKSVARWALAPNQRTYTRNQLVWVCPECSGDAASERERAEKAQEREEQLEIRKEQMRYGSIAEEFWRLHKPIDLGTLGFFMALMVGTWRISNNEFGVDYVWILLGLCAIFSLLYLPILGAVQNGANSDLLHLANLYKDRSESNPGTENVFAQEVYWKGYDFSIKPSRASISKMALRPEYLNPKQFDADHYVSAMSFRKALILSFLSIVAPSSTINRMSNGLLGTKPEEFALNLILLIALVCVVYIPFTPFWSSIAIPLIFCILLRSPMKILMGNAVDGEGRLILKPRFAVYKLLRRSDIPLQNIGSVTTLSSTPEIDKGADIFLETNIDTEILSSSEPDSDGGSWNEKYNPLEADDLRINIPISADSADKTETKVGADKTETKEVSCIRCGSTQLSARQRGFNWKIALPLGFFTGGFGLLIGFWGRKNIITTCVACGCTWKRKPTE